MKKARLLNLEKTVKEILEKDTHAREDDCYLILLVVRKLYPFEVGKTFTNVMFNAKSKGLSFESITRCRRKLQRKYPELRDEATVQAREEEQQEYRDYAKE